MGEKEEGLDAACSACMLLRCAAIHCLKPNNTLRETVERRALPIAGMLIRC